MKLSGVLKFTEENIVKVDIDTEDDSVSTSMEDATTGTIKVLEGTLEEPEDGEGE